MTLGPTIYPLLFAALGGRSSRGFALWLAENGTTIEVGCAERGQPKHMADVCEQVLEKLLGSQSVVSAVYTAFVLRSANVLSLSLLVLWAFSPLGGQSSLRLMYETNSTIHSSATIYYAAPGASFFPTFTVPPTVLVAGLTSADTIKGGPVDSWNHPKIPRLDEVESGDIWPGDAEREWHTVDTDSTNMIYPSWTGVNIQGLYLGWQSQAQLRYNYLTLDCKLRFQGTHNDTRDLLLNSSDIVRPYIRAVSSLWEVTMSLADGGSTSFEGPDFLKFTFTENTGNNASDRDSSTYLEGEKNETVYIPRYLYGVSANRTDRNAEIHLYECTQRIITVDAELSCESDSCKVNRLRRVPNEPRVEAKERCTTFYRGENRLACLTASTSALAAFVQSLPIATSPHALVGQFSPFIDYVYNGATTGQAYNSSTMRSWDEVSTANISQRLTVLLNTYWQAASWDSQTVTADPYAMLFMPALADGVNGQSLLNTTNAILWRNIPIYKANLPWIITLLITTSILLIIGSLHLVISLLTIAPDFFNLVSSLTRENQYTDVPPGGTANDGGEKSRRLRDLKVQIADVRPKDEVGYIALKSVASNAEFLAGRLRSERLYQ